jgi:hypothetical protein
MNNAAKDSEIGMPFLIDCSDQTNGFETGEAIDKISAIKTFPVLDGGN